MGWAMAVFSIATALAACGCSPLELHAIRPAADLPETLQTVTVLLKVAQRSRLRTFGLPAAPALATMGYNRLGLAARRDVAEPGTDARGIREGAAPHQAPR